MHIIKKKKKKKKSLAFMKEGNVSSCSTKNREGTGAAVAGGWLLNKS
jgi:hypothetical protein